MKKIAWITGSSFFDVDENILPVLNKQFDIYWIVMRQRESFYSFDSISEHYKRNDIKGEIVEFNSRLRSFNSFNSFLKLVWGLKKMDYDILYINYLGIPWLFPLLKLLCVNKKKTVYACHDYVDHLNIKNRKYIQNYKKKIFKRYSNFQFFSETQMQLFHNDYPDKKAFYAPLLLKQFGVSDLSPRKDKVVFLFFGTIRENKGIELLLEAGNMLYDKHPEKFIIRVFGNTKQWDKYKGLIKHENAFELQIRRIENEEIADLFSTSHYLILPYLDVTQSGPLLISYNYHLPVIASKLPGFSEYIEDEKTGFLFESANAESLYEKMLSAVEQHETAYPQIKNRLEEFVRVNCNTNEIISRYAKFFINNETNP